MADETLADHDVADAEGRIDSACDTGKDQRPAPEAFEQQGRHQRCIDLAEPGFDGDQRDAVERAGQEGQARNRLLLLDGQGRAKVRQLLGNGCDQADRTICHDRKATRLQIRVL